MEYWARSEASALILVGKAVFFYQLVLSALRTHYSIIPIFHYSIVYSIVLGNSTSLKNIKIFQHVVEFQRH
jgi:hypothetical protein